MNRRVAAEQRGRGAERIAAWWLRLRGWRILAQRARVPGGEVDLIARRGRIVAFVEVKARGSQEGRPWLSTSIGFGGSRSPPSAWRRATPATATTSASMRFSSCPADCRATWPMSGTGDSAARPN